MNFDIRKNNILAIIPSQEYSKKNSKIYQHSLSGTIFSSEDFQLPVFHKKTIKIINWKDLGDKMQVFIIPLQRVSLPTDKKIDIPSFEYAFDLFQGFDEETGETYSFLYKIKSRKIETLAPLLDKYAIHLKTKENIFIKKTLYNTPPENFDTLSFLFGLFCIYGAFHKKGTTVLGAKIFIPLFGPYTALEDFFITIFSAIKNDSFFIHSSLQDTNDGKNIQISITDYEILTLFVKRYQKVENFSEITKLIEVRKAKELLMLYGKKHIANYDSDILGKIKKIKLASK